MGSNGRIKSIKEIRLENQALKKEKKYFSLNLCESEDLLDELKKEIIKKILSNKNFDESFKYLYSSIEYSALNAYATERLTLERICEISFFLDNPEDIDAKINNIKEALVKEISNRKEINELILKPEIKNLILNGQSIYFSLDFLVNLISQISLVEKLNKSETKIDHKHIAHIFGKI